MLIAKFDQLISIVTKLAEDVRILNSRKGVPVATTSPIATTPPVDATSPVATITSITATPPPTARVPIDATPSLGVIPPTTSTPSYANTPNMLTNDGYWYNSNEGDEVPNDGNDGHTHSSLANEDNSIPMKMDEVVGIVGEPSDEGVVIKAPMEGKDKGGDKANSEKDRLL